MNGQASGLLDGPLDALWAWAVALTLGVAVGAAGAWLVLARRRRRGRRAAERREQEIEALTRGLAHEIKNPLSTIGLNAQLVAEAVSGLEAPDDQLAPIRRRLDALRRENERLAGILQDFLEFAGEVRLSPADEDLNAIAEELGDFFAAQASRAGVRLRVETAPDPLPARLDADHLKQAAMNLILNALQAMERASDSVRERELIVRAVRTRLDGRPAVALHVIDTGPGIDAASRARIFDPYYTTRAGGTGLGLPTTRRIVEAHGGRLELFSEPGTGTDFAMIIPAGQQ